MISGVNLPATQTLIGMGVPLHRIPDVRRLFGQPADATGPIDFDKTPAVPPLGDSTFMNLCWPHLEACTQASPRLALHTFTAYWMIAAGQLQSQKAFSCLP